MPGRFFWSTAYAALLPRLAHLVRVGLERRQGVVVEAELVGELDVNILCKPVGGADHAEQQHGYEGEGQRKDAAAEEEIVQTELIGETIPCVGQLTAAADLDLLLCRNGRVGRRHLQLFHKKAPFCIKIKFKRRGP